MNAQEWLKNEGYNFKVETNTDIPARNFMEKYADYKTQKLKDKILEWRNNYLKTWSEMENSESEFAEYLLNQFDIQFNIE